MKQEILIITNNQLSSLPYTLGLAGDGYNITEISTFEMARIRFKAGMIPHLIIIDNQSYEDLSEFIHDMHLTYGRGAIPIVVVGAPLTQGFVVGANNFIPRPVSIDNIRDTIEAYTA